MRIITSVKNHNGKYNLYDKSSWEGSSYGKCPISDKGPPLLVEDQGGEEESPISDKRPPLLVKDRGVTRKVQFWTKDLPSW